MRAVESPSARLSDLRSVTGLVLTRDPLRPGLSLRQRHERLTAGFRRAVEAIDACVTKQPAVNNALESLRAEAGALEPQLTLERLRRTPELTDTALNLIYRMEQQTLDVCGEGAALDRALLLIARRHEADRQ